MTLWESRESSGEISLKVLFSGTSDLGGCGAVDLEWIAFAICRGGWPGSLNQSKSSALQYAGKILDEIADTDISRADGVARDETKAKKIMRACARMQGAAASLPALIACLKEHEDFKISDVTLASYLNALSRIFVIEDLPAWTPKLLTRTAVRTGKARYFADPSIAAAALGLKPDDLMADLRVFEVLFKTLCVRDLRVYAEANGGTVFHYRDKNGLKCDAVVWLRNGSYALVETALGGETQVSESAAVLRKLADRIDTAAMKKPSFMMVLTAMGSYAYWRNDGILVAPVSCLKD